ncbi:MAG: hypothetical protein IBX55_00525 [Methyloprofundus sp.]|nr:hypothetical protein [Methyloprofundus sp.]
MKIKCTGKQLNSFWDSEWGSEDAFIINARFGLIDGSDFLYDDLDLQLNGGELFSDDQVFTSIEGVVDVNGKEIDLGALFKRWLKKNMNENIELISVQVPSNKVEVFKSFLVEHGLKQV